MADWDWVEAVGPTVEKAVQAAIDDMGLESPESAEIEVIREGKSGFLGLGGEDAVVRVRPKPKKSGRRRRRGGRGRGGSGKNGGDNGSRSRQGSSQSKPQSERRSSGGSKPKKDRAERAPRQPQRNDRSKPQRKEEPMEVEVDRTEQAVMVKEFLDGLLDAFGLDGTVETRVEDDIIHANVSGEQTEALVGHKGAILQATHELCRTIVQRKSQAGARLRLDIAGYQERRREALRIYTGRLVEKLVAEGGEVMLEPMNPADRKVVHDAAAELGGVRTYSEGEEPNRSVVLAKDE